MMQMEVGMYTYGAELLTLKLGESNLKIGKFCSIADDIRIFLGNTHRTDWITTYPFGHIHKDVFTKFNGEGHPKTNGDVIIGNDVWVASGVTIMSGVHIGDGAVIAANSHVVKDVEAYSIVGGNPAKLIKYRFDYGVRKKLLKLKWWDFDIKVIDEISPLLCSSQFDKLFEICEQYNK